MSEEQRLQLRDKIRKFLVDTQNSTAIMFLDGNPTPLFISQLNAEKQVVVEQVFAEAENPEKREEKLRGYITWELDDLKMVIVIKCPYCGSGNIQQSFLNF